MTPVGRARPKSLPRPKRSGIEQHETEHVDPAGACSARADTAEDGGRAHRLVWLDPRGLAVHPRDIRDDLGDLSGLADSIAAQGVLEDSGLLEQLTDRECEVLVAVAGGMSNDEIGQELHMSPATARTHVGRVLTKLAARDRAQLVAMAWRAGLMSPARDEPAITSTSSATRTPGRAAGHQGR